MLRNGLGRLTVITDALVQEVEPVANNQYHEPSKQLKLIKMIIHSLT